MALTFVTIHSKAKLTLFILSFLTPPSRVIATNPIQNEVVDQASSKVVSQGLVCLGQGVDSTVVGVVASIVILFVIGLLLWVGL